MSLNYRKSHVAADVLHTVVYVKGHKQQVVIRFEGSSHAVSDRYVSWCSKTVTWYHTVTELCHTVAEVGGHGLPAGHHDTGGHVVRV